ncbi:MAG: dihydrodipicolinate synthase family protein [Clostridiales bacterium]|nr:dihydrodipicolinate synthase family protein [Clostridiales bacterium]
MSIKRFTGVMPPMMTPFTAEGAVDYGAFTANMERWNEDALSGYLVNGSNSETAYLSEQEKLKLLRLTVKHSGPGRRILAGTGVESLAETIRFTNACAGEGAEFALVLTPCYYHSNMTSAALTDFFTRLADASDIPVLIYNVPKFTHVNIKADAVKALSAHPNIVGMKDSTGDVSQLASFLAATAGQDFEILVGTVSAWFPALTLGIVSGIHATANCAPNACAAVQQAFTAKDNERARAIYQLLLPLNTAVTATYGIAGLKYAANLLGYTGGAVRCPLQPLSEKDCMELHLITETARQKLEDLGVKP